MTAGEGALEIALARQEVRRSKALSLERIDDERKSLGIKILHPLKSVTVEINKGKNSDGTDNIVTKNFDEEIKREFEYLSRTGDLETDGPRVKELQAIADRMTAGANLAARVVIVNKGKSPNAFVTPDGTIFVSQSCLNLLESMDEIGGVIGHEIRHLAQKTFEKQVASGGTINSFAVGWLHEMTSDTLAAELLEKAGLNSLGMSSSIKKLSGETRGLTHQGGFLRSTEVLAQHNFVDYRTSTTVVTPAVEVLHKPAEKTNLEIVNEAIKKGNVKNFEEILPFLHPQDFQEIFVRIGQKRYDTDIKSRKMTESCWDFISLSMKNAGYSETETKLFLASILPYHENLDQSSFYWDLIRERLIKTPKDFLFLAKAAVNFDTAEQGKKMNKLIFNKNDEVSARNELKEYLKQDFYDATEEQRKAGIPLTRETLMEVIKEVYNNEYRWGMNDVVLDYINQVFLTRPPDGQIDEDQLREFFGELKDLGVSISGADAEIRWRTFTGNDDKEGYFSFNAQIAIKIIYEVYGGIRIEANPEEIIGWMFENFPEDLKSYLEYNFVETFRKLQSFFLENKLNDSEKLVWVERFASGIDRANFGGTTDWRHFLETGEIKSFDADTLPVEEKEINQRLFNLSLKLFFARSFFSEDSSQFYDFVDRAVVNSGIDLASLPDNQFRGLAFNFINKEKCPSIFGSYFRSTPSYLVTSGILAKFTDFDRLCETILVKELLNRHDQTLVNNFGELNKYGLEKLLRLIPDKSKENVNIFSDQPEMVLFGRGIREKFLQLLGKETDLADYPELLVFLKTYYPDGILRSRLIREIRRSYLLSPETSLDEKTTYLLENFDDIGPEGLGVVASQIFTLAEYLVFEQKIGKKLQESLGGESKKLKVLAGSDVVGSLLTSEHEDLFTTAVLSEKEKERQSTNFARSWLGAFFYSFDPKSEKFVHSAFGPTFLGFKSFPEILTSLHETDSFSRYLLCLKALEDENGALTSRENKKRLAQNIVKSLDLAPGFVSSAIKAVILTGKEEVIGFPAANILAPLLFRSLDANSINIERLRKMKIMLEDGDPKKVGRTRDTVLIGDMLSAEQLNRFFSSSTEDLIFYGYPYRSHLNSRIALLSQETFRQGGQAQKLLEKFLDKENEAQKKELSLSERTEVGSSTEAIIKGVEVSGALGVRSLQLARQLYHFSPEIDRRLADCMDSAEGLTKLGFWHNLVRFMEADSQIKKFCEERLISVDDCLGGGSLFTTFAATVRGENGEAVPVVLKMLRPNAEAFVEKTYQLAKTSLETTAKENPGKIRADSRMGQTLVDLSREWCIKDIDDQTFLKDDEDYRQRLARFNQGENEELFFAPELVFNTRKLKSETLAPGRTLNKVLGDETIAFSEKRELVAAIGRLFAFEMGNKGESGSYLIRSDPHIGNYVVNSANDGHKIAIIDRGLYLRLEEADMQVIKALVFESGQEFLNLLTNRVMDINDVSEAKRREVGIGVQRVVLEEYLKQKFRSRADNFSILHRVLADFSQRGLEVPLSLRLMIKNVGSVGELLNKYGLKWEDVI